MIILILLGCAHVHSFRLQAHGLQVVGHSLGEDELEERRNRTEHTRDAGIAEAASTIRNSQSSPFSYARRTARKHMWCSCGAGLNRIEFWAGDDTTNKIALSSHTIKWVKLKAKQIRYKCDGSRRIRSVHIPGSEDAEWVSSTLVLEQRPGATCRKITGRILWNLWEQTDYVSNVPFTSGTEGYACFKIPSLLVTNAGTVLAFAEGRKPDCHDFSETEVVYKRSIDGGKTWGDLKRVVEIHGDKASLGECGHPLVVGNIAPVQLSATSVHHPNRILVPYTRNNFRQWQVHSDDDGVTFSGDREIMATQDMDTHPNCNRSMSNYFGFRLDRISFRNMNSIRQWVREVCKLRNPYEQKSWTSKLAGQWQFLGVGPGNGIQLSNGRILLPGYHSYIRGLVASGSTLPTSQLYNNFAIGHTLISDDDGDTWRVRVWPLGQGANENNLVELTNGSVLANSRSLATGSPQYRLQALSDDGGESFSQSTYVFEQPQPFNGCQGAMVSQDGVPSNTVYVSSPDPNDSNSILQKLANSIGCKVNLTGRRKLTVWRSDDGGTTYPKKVVLDEGLAAQTALAFLNGKLVALHEQSDEASKTVERIGKSFLRDLSVLLPTRFVFREVIDI